MNTEVMFSSRTDLWETPQDFFDRLNDEFHFKIDVCALPHNAKCERFFTPEQDGLFQPWVGCCWCNPPYGRQVSEWVRKAWESSAAGSTVVMLLPARTDTRWFHDYIYLKSRVEVRFIRGRLKFGGNKNSAPFPSMVVIFRPKNEPKKEGSQNAKQYPWWSYVKYLVRKYPDWSEAPGEKMYNSERAGWAAVNGAVEETEYMMNGLARLKLIKLLHWEKTHTLEGAAMSIPCDRATAARWQRRFFEEVAKNRGLLD